MTQPGTGRMPGPAAVRLRLLGSADVERSTPAGVERLAVQSKRLALLGCLAASPGGGLRRDTLLGLFWPDLDTERARGALNKAVHYLRRTLGDAAIVSRGDEELALDAAHVASDVAAFHTALESGRPADALQLYGGELLTGLYVSDAPEWEKWLDARRLALREQALGAAWELASAAAAASQPVEAGAWARRAIGLAGHDETVVRRAIDFLADIGDRAGALRAYDEFARLLAGEYEIEPAPETQAAVTRIRAAQAAPHVPASAGDAAAPDATASSTALSSAPASYIPAPGASEAAAPRPLPATAADGLSAGVSRSHRRHILAGASLVALAAAVTLWPVFAGSPDPTLDARRVVVAPLDNRTGDPSLDVLGQMAADWVLHGLSQSGSVELVPVTAIRSSVRYVLTLPDATDSALRVAALARETGAGVAVWGSYYLQGDSLWFSVRVTDVARDRVLFSLDPVSTTPAEAVEAIEELRRRVLAALAPLLDPRMADYAGLASRPPSFEAYRAYAEGIDRFVTGNWRGAIEMFATASAADPSYTLPLVMQAIAYANLGQFSRVDSLAELLAPLHDALPEYDRLAITAAAAWARGDYATSYRAAVRVSELAPNTIGHGQVAAEAFALNRPREARDVLLRLDPGRGELRGWIMYWSNLADAHHALGEYRAELRAAQRLADQSADSRLAWLHQLRALAALRRDAAVLETARALIAADPPFTAAVLQQTAVELRAHGRAEAALQVLRLSRAWDAQRADTASPAWRRQRAEALYLGGEWDASHRLYSELAAELPGRLLLEGRLATLALRRGDPLEAARLDSALAVRDEPYLHGEHHVWRARLAALRGDEQVAVDLLRAAFAAGRWNRIDLHADPDFEPIRHSRAWQAFMRPAG